MQGVRDVAVSDHKRSRPEFPFLRREDIGQGQVLTIPVDVWELVPWLGSPFIAASVKADIDVSYVRKPFSATFEFLGLVYDNVQICLADSEMNVFSDPLEMLHKFPKHLWLLE